MINRIEQREWWRRRAMLAGAIIVSGFLLLAIFADFLAPYRYSEQSRQSPFAPRAVLHWRDAAGGWHARPFIYVEHLIDPLGYRYATDTRQAYRLVFFTQGYSYHLFWLFPTNRHLFGLQNAETNSTRIYLLGADALGRDRFSRLLVAARFSLLVGPTATLLAGLLGVMIGFLAGYIRRWLTGFTGLWLNVVLMRGTDVMLALPVLVLMLAARATLPPELPPVRAALLMITIFVVLGWAEMARLAYGLVLELRERNFVYAAVSLGSSPARVLFRHILPNAIRPLMAQMLLILPMFLMAEISLSFLGVGLQEPEPGWGNMLRATADLSLLERSDAWAQVTPACAIWFFVLGIRLLGEGLQSGGRK